MAEAVFDMREAAHKLTLTCRVVRFREWRWRLKLGLWLMRLAALVMWVNIDIELTEDGELIHNLPTPEDANRLWAEHEPDD